MTESLNRAFLYGESIFTTMRMKDNLLCDWDEHFDRLRRGIEYLYGPFNESQEWSILFKNLIEVRLENESGNKIIRLTVYLEGSRGLSRGRLISVSDLKIHVHSSLIDPLTFSEQSFKLRTCPAPSRPYWWPSFLKSGNYLENILLQKMYLKEGDDDLLFLSGMDTVLESSVANIFIVRNKKLYTAPLGPHVLEGVMRKKILEASSEFFEEVTETESTLLQVYKADMIFGSNSVRGPFLIDRVDDHELKREQNVLNLFKKLISTVYP